MQTRGLTLTTACCGSSRSPFLALGVIDIGEQLPSCSLGFSDPDPDLDLDSDHGCCCFLVLLYDLRYDLRLLHTLLASHRLPCLFTPASSAAIRLKSCSAASSSALPSSPRVQSQIPAQRHHMPGDTI